MSTPNLTQMILETQYSAFKNNTIATGTFTISGSTAAGTNTRTFTAALTSTPDMVDIVFNGPGDGGLGINPRPSTAWFKQGQVWVHTNGAGGGDPGFWKVFGTITGAVLTVTAIMVQQFTTAEVLVATNFSYRVIDYSVF